MKLIAIGGGGFTAETDAYLDDFVLTLAKGNDTRLGFLGTASHHDPNRLERLYRLMAPKTKSASHLSPCADQYALSIWLQEIDLLYIGGGDTEHLQAVWTARNYWPVLQSAIAQDLWVAGVSAGAVIWFEAALVRNQQKQLQHINGAGYISGSVCVHFSSEPDRQTAYVNAIQRAIIPAGIAIDDGVAVVFEPDKKPYYATARDRHQAHYCDRSGLSPFNKVNG